MVLSPPEAQAASKAFRILHGLVAKRLFPTPARGSSLRLSIPSPVNRAPRPAFQGAKLPLYVEPGAQTLLQRQAGMAFSSGTRIVQQDYFTFGRRLVGCALRTESGVSGYAPLTRPTFCPCFLAPLGRG